MTDNHPFKIFNRLGLTSLLALLAVVLVACSGPGPSRTATARASASSGPITLAGTCKQTENDGYTEDARVNVIRGKVTSLAWQIDIPKRGTCSFHDGQFRQTKSSPGVELLARDGSGCKLMMWSDKRRITLAHAGCASFCTPGSYGKAWPVMFNPRTGGCADIRR